MLQDFTISETDYEVGLRIWISHRPSITFLETRIDDALECTRAIRVHQEWPTREHHAGQAIRRSAMPSRAQKIVATEILN